MDRHGSFYWFGGGSSAQLPGSHGLHLRRPDPYALSQRVNADADDKNDAGHSLLSGSFHTLDKSDYES